MLPTKEERIKRKERTLAEVHGVFKSENAPDLGLDYLQPVFDLLGWTGPDEAALCALTNRSEALFRHNTPTDFLLEGEDFSFSSNVRTAIAENNMVHGRFFPGRADKHAIVILPYWNAHGPSFDGVARLFSLLGIAALRLSLPYHDERKPEHWRFAEYMVSSNIGRTIHAVRQAVLDVRCAIDWLYARGYESVSLVGMSIGSCIATIAAAHDRRVGKVAQLLMASNFAEVVWTGMATVHIRDSLKNWTGLERLKHLWRSISPDSYTPRLAANGTRVLMITGRYDPVFLPHLAAEMDAAYRAEGVQAHWRTQGCGHYTLGQFPYNYRAILQTLLWLKRRTS